MASTGTPEPVPTLSLAIMLPALVVALVLQGAGRDLGSTGYAEIESPDALLQVGPWRAWLDSPEGELPFALEIARDGKKLSATIGNGEEKIAVPETRLEGGDLVFDMPHYDSKITAKIAPLGTKLDGEWKKRSGVDRWTTLKFHATAGAASRFTPSAKAAAAQLEGRWSAHFDKGEETGVLVLRKGAESTVEGTFLMPTGDYRWLAGTIDGDRLRLSCFDGAHAFLFDATASAGGGWSGKFWSGDRWQDTWNAKLDPNAQLADEFGQAHWKEGIGLAELLYPDLDGNEHSLGEEAFAGKAMVIQILGSWCPNCHDETAYLARVYDRYKERGLSVVGLAFELTGDFARDAEQARRMRTRHKASYPFLLAGLSDKKKAAEAFPALDRVFAFPTTIFLHRDGRVRAIHSGFSGPGTREEHEKLAKKFEGIIEELLAEPDSKDDRAVWSDLSDTEWWENPGEIMLRFEDDSAKRHVFVREADESRGPVSISGSTVTLGDSIWHYDRSASVLLDPRDFGHRIRPFWWKAPSIDGEGIDRIEQYFDWLKNPDPLVRREAVFYMPAIGPTRTMPELNPVPMLSDSDVLVRCVAAVACAKLRATEGGPRLVEMTKRGFAGERREAALAIGDLHYAAGADALRALVKDIDPLVRKAAAKALAKVERP